MSVFGGVLLFVAGVATGGGAIVFNRVCIQRETSQLRRENDHLKNTSWQDKLEYECYRAYRRGYHEGRKSPLSAVEELADTLEQHNARVKVRRE